ncbi:MAG: SAM-dependent DNA methyltransferase, partial [Proteobacteria bacterium]|nr:SAM-dependent DNA methyltransferase [Pseudomonadota bacterium]
MNHTVHNNIVSFIWNIADDILRDVYVRGKYRDVILPMTVIRRLDILLESSKDAVLETYNFLDEQGIEPTGAAFVGITGYPFYNTSQFTLRRLLAEPSQIEANFRAYLEGYSQNVKEIIYKFKFHNQIETLAEANRLYALIDTFLTTKINLSILPVKDSLGNEIQPGLSNLGMGYVFEELIRKFNEENNEEAGEHFTPRDIIQLMTHLLFLPIQDQIESGTYLVYDGACGSGGMLTESERYFTNLAEKNGKTVRTELYGQEVQSETYAICTADMLIKNESPDNIAFASTLAHDAFSHMKFDFMLSNPPYGKSWKVDKEYVYDGKKKEVIDPRFTVGLPRTSDGQLLFLVNKLTKMKSTERGSRIAMVHNGSALFTGDAGQGESEIRKWIIENDWLEAIIGLPLNMFYNTGIATYIWVLTNRKPEHRRNKVQLIDARELFTKLRKNLGSKNCEFTGEHINHIIDTFLRFEGTEISKLFDNDDFGYTKITVDRPLRLTTHITPERMSAFVAESPQKLHPLADAFKQVTGEESVSDFNTVTLTFEGWLKANKVKATKSQLKQVYNAFTTRDENAEPVIKKRSKKGEAIYESDTQLRDYENIPMKEDISAYFTREVLPYVSDAWIDHEKTVVGYEISFTKYFYQYEPLRNLEEIVADIRALEAETEGLLHQIIEILFFRSYFLDFLRFSYLLHIAYRIIKLLYTGCGFSSLGEAMFI